MDLLTLTIHDSLLKFDEKIIAYQVTKKLVISGELLIVLI